MPAPRPLPPPVTAENVSRRCHTSPGGQNCTLRAPLPAGNERALAGGALHLCASTPRCPIKGSGLTDRPASVRIPAVPLSSCVMAGEWPVSESQLPHGCGGAETAAHPSPPSCRDSERSSSHQGHSDGPWEVLGWASGLPCSSRHHVGRTEEGQGRLG